MHNLLVSKTTSVIGFFASENLKLGNFNAFPYRPVEYGKDRGHLRVCLSKILITILDHITDFLVTLHVSYTL